MSGFPLTEESSHFSCLGFIRVCPILRPDLHCLAHSSIFSWSLLQHTCRPRPWSLGSCCFLSLEGFPEIFQKTCSKAKCSLLAIALNWLIRHLIPSFLLAVLARSYYICLWSVFHECMWAPMLFPPNVFISCVCTHTSEHKCLSIHVCACVLVCTWHYHHLLVLRIRREDKAGRPFRTC